MILVTGATGNTGRLIVEALIAKGEKPRVFVRSAEKAKPLAARGVDVKMGDLRDPLAVAATLEGVDAVYLVSSPDHGAKELREAEVQRSFIDAAKRARVRHIVRLSALGADATSEVALLRWHGEVDDALARADVPFTILRPNYFMQNLFMSLPTLQAGGLIALPISGGARISQVDARDIAAVATASLTTKGHEGKTYVVTGPEALTFTDVAERLSILGKRAVRFMPAPPDMAKAGMMGAGMAEWVADGMLKLFAFFDRGEGARITSTVKDVTGNEPRRIDDFLASFVLALDAPRAGA